MADVSHTQHELFAQQSKSMIYQASLPHTQFKWRQLIDWHKRSSCKLRQSTILRVTKGKKYCNFHVHAQLN